MGLQPIESTLCVVACFGWFQAFMMTSLHRTTKLRTGKRKEKVQHKKQNILFSFLFYKLCFLALARAYKACAEASAWQARARGCD